MPKDILEGKINQQEIARVSESHVNRLYKHKLLKGDIVYGRRGDIGRQAITNDEQVGWLCGTGCLRISLGDAPVIPEFLHRYLQIEEIIGWIQNQAIGATMPNLNTNILRRVPVFYPEKKEEQKKITAILSACDDFIENNNRRIALLEKMAEEIYREWFVRMRFPGHENVKFQKGLPEGWGLIPVADAFEFTGGGTPSKQNLKYWENGTINWFTPSDITSSDGIFLEESGIKCTKEGVQKSSAKIFPPYSVMMTSRATIGALGINTTYACTNQGFISCIPNQRYPMTFLYHWLKLNKVYFEMLSSGATFLELIKSTFKKIYIITPPEDIVAVFDRNVSALFNSIESLSKQTKILKDSRNRLLPRLISGKLSVEELDIRFPESMLEESRAELDQ